MLNPFETVIGFTANFPLRENISMVALLMPLYVIVNRFNEDSFCNKILIPRNHYVLTVRGKVICGKIITS